MKRWKILLAATLICLLVLGITAVGIIHHFVANQDSVAEDFWIEVKAIIAEFPVLQDPYVITECYFNDGNFEYLILKSNKNQITGLRNAKGEIVYYTAGKAWLVTPENGLIEVRSEVDPVVPAVSAAIKELTDDPYMTYSYHVAAGQSLPLWVYPGEHYLYCQRPSYPEHIEVIVMDRVEEGEYFRWDIVRNAEDVMLYLQMQAHMPSGQVTHYLSGWGYIDDAVFSLILGE